MKIPIINDELLENSELVRIYAVPPSMPFGVLRCYADLLIADDDDGKIHMLIYTKIPTCV